MLEYASETGDKAMTVNSWEEGQTSKSGQTSTRGKIKDIIIESFMSYLNLSEYVTVPGTWVSCITSILSLK